MFVAGFAVSLGECALLGDRRRTQVVALEAIELKATIVVTVSNSKLSGNVISCQFVCFRGLSFRLRRTIHESTRINTNTELRRL
jgi:hypothetical protein